MDFFAFIFKSNIILKGYYKGRLSNGKNIEEITLKVCENLIKPKEVEIEEQGLYIKEVLSKLGELGYFGISFPKEFGGVGLSFEEGVKASIVLARYSSTISMIIGAHQLASLAILISGNDKLKVNTLHDSTKVSLLVHFHLRSRKQAPTPQR